jgi:carbon-monoxide dehydrogenase medium subunit
MAIAVRFPVPDDRTAGSPKVERKVGDFATAAAAVQISLNENGTIRQAGVALSAADHALSAWQRPNVS